MPKRNEAPSITIANLERENRNLTERCADLVKARDDLQRDKHALQVSLASREGEVEELRTLSNEANAELQYERGYISRVKEHDKLVYSELKD